jgi:hypothetical protein
MTGIEIYRKVLKEDLERQEDFLSKRLPNKSYITARIQVMGGVAMGLRAAGMITEEEETMLSWEATEAFRNLILKYYK